MSFVNYYCIKSSRKHLLRPLSLGIGICNVDGLVSHGRWAGLFDIKLEEIPYIYMCDAKMI
jgi:hypothetical protein